MFNLETSFSKAITHNYVDKTESIFSLFPNDNLNNSNDPEQQIFCLLAPQRFGKTLTLSMFESFLTTNVMKQTSFSGLKIGSDYYKEFRATHMYKHPVLTLDLRQSFNEETLAKEIAKVCVNLENDGSFRSELLTDEEKKIFNSLKDVVLPLRKNCLKFLFGIVAKYHTFYDNNLVFLLDSVDFRINALYESYFKEKFLSLTPLIENDEARQLSSASTENNNCFPTDFNNNSWALKKKEIASYTSVLKEVFFDIFAEESCKEKYKKGALVVAGCLPLTGLGQFKKLKVALGFTETEVLHALHKAALDIERTLEVYREFLRKNFGGFSFLGYNELYSPLGVALFVNRIMYYKKQHGNFPKSVDKTFEMYYYWADHIDLEEMASSFMKKSINRIKNFIRGLLFLLKDYDKSSINNIEQKFIIYKEIDYEMLDNFNIGDLIRLNKAIDVTKAMNNLRQYNILVDPLWTILIAAGYLIIIDKRSSKEKNQNSQYNWRICNLKIMNREAYTKLSRLFKNISRKMQALDSQAENVTEEKEDDEE